MQKAGFLFCFMLSLIDGTAQKNPKYPAWSPTNKQIVFSAEIDGYNHICIIDSSGNNKRVLTRGKHNNFWPSWTNDGRAIIFDSDRNGNQDLFMIEIESGEISQLTFNAAFDAVANTVPGKEWVLFDSNREPDSLADVYLMNYKTGAVRNITKRSLSSAHGALSKKADRLVFKSRLSTASEELFIFDLDSQKITQLTSNQHRNIHPCWSPNDNQIVFSSNMNGGAFNLYTIDLKANEIVRLTYHDANDYRPSFSNDGKRLLYCTNNAGEWSVQVLDIHTNTIRTIGMK